MKVLELFKGSGSITKYYENTDIEVISLDILQKYNPTICSDIMTWDYKIYEPKTFDIIEYFKPKFYFIENPRYSAIWDYIENEKYKYNFVIVDYCAFGYNYKKPTKILTNKLLDNVLCSCTGDPKHNFKLGVTSKKFLEERNIQEKDTTTLNQRYSIPPKLLTYLLE